MLNRPQRSLLRGRIICREHIDEIIPQELEEKEDFCLDNKIDCMRAWELIPFIGAFEPARVTPDFKQHIGPHVSRMACLVNSQRL